MRFWFSRPPYFNLRRLKKVTNAEHTVCVRTCAPVRHMACAVRSCSLFLQVYAAFVEMEPRPSPTAPRRLHLTRFDWKDMLCGYLHQHVGVMAYLFFFSTVSFFLYSCLCRHLRRVLRFLAALNTEARVVVWFRRGKLKALLIDFYSFPLVYFWVGK